MTQVEEKWRFQPPVYHQDSFREYTLQKAEQLRQSTACNRILFIVSGCVQVSMEKQTLNRVEQRHMFFVRAQAACHITALEDTVLLVIQTESQPLEPEFIGADTPSLPAEKSIVNPLLKLTPLITHFLATLKASLAYDLQTPEYTHLKVRELYWLISWEYSQQQAAGFFWGNQTSDKPFYCFVINTYKKVQTIAQMAEMACYSPSGFDKRFRKVFNASPSQWLRDRKAADVYNEICTGQKTFKQISLEYGFCSPAHFNDFCKATLGHTPGQIRRKNLSGLDLKAGRTKPINIQQIR